MSKLAMRLCGVAGAVATAAAVLAAPANAQQDIPWTWNSSDHNIRAKFESTGEHLYAQEVTGDDYVDWQAASRGLSRWWIPGNHDGNTKDLDLDLPENQWFSMKVCQYWSVAPDDCSAWKQGQS